MHKIKKIKNNVKLKSLILTSFLVENYPEVYIMIAGVFFKKRVLFTLCFKFQSSIGLLYIKIYAANILKVSLNNSRFIFWISRTKVWVLTNEAQMKGIAKAVPFFIAFTYQLMKTLLEVGFQYALIIRKALFRGLRKLTKLR